MLILISVTFAAKPVRADGALLQLLQERQCPQCQLEDADLVHADLRDADLSDAKLMRANLSRAQLDGANLSGADLRFSNLQGASLRGVDLRKSNLYGTDLRQADLTGAKLNSGTLDQAHWKGVRGLAKEVLTHASLHNAGVESAHKNKWEEAERFFSSAISTKPSEPLSWIARGLCRGELGRTTMASQDFAYASELFRQQGDLSKSEQLIEASRLAIAPEEHPREKNNGFGSSLLSGVLSTAYALAPLALRALSPLAP